MKPVFIVFLISNCPPCDKFPIGELKTELQNSFKIRLSQWHIIKDNTDIHHYGQKHDQKLTDEMIIRIKKYITEYPALIFFPAYTWKKLLSDTSISNMPTAQYLKWNQNVTTSDIILWIEQQLDSKKYFMYY